MFADSLCERLDRESGKSGHVTVPARLARERATSIGYVSTDHGIWIYGDLNGHVVCWSVDRPFGQAMGCGTVARFVRPNGFVAV